MMLSYLFFGISYAFAAGVQPGPLQTYFISQTLKNGWKKTVPAALAPVISDIPIVILVLFILRSFPDSFAYYLRLVGGFFLIYLAYKAFTSWRNYIANQELTKNSGKQTLYGAIAVNLLNPNPYLGWSLILGPLFLEGWKVAPVNGIALVSGFYLTLVLTMSGTIILFALTRKLGPKIIKILLGLSALVLLLFGIYQIWLGIEFLLKNYLVNH